MAAFWEILKVFCLGILEGVTEWLPISSTGHLLLLDQFLVMDESASFKEVFFVVVQLGAILAVFFHFWKKMLPSPRSQKSVSNCISLWLKVALACVPGAIVTFLFDNQLEKLFSRGKIGEIPLAPAVIATALILYGALFILVEGRKKRPPHIETLEDLRFSHAFFIGLFQALSIIPGTSRSGSTIIGARTLGISRGVATEFTFFLAVPVMLGYSLLKIAKIGFCFSPYQLRLLLIGSLSAFITSLFVIRFLMAFVKKHSFAFFGFYRIALGVLVLLYFLL